jgi:hypothetical protein
MMVEIDEVCVDSELWARAEDGDTNAIQALKDGFHETVLYVHALTASVPPNTWVRLKDLERLGIVRSIRLNTKDYGQVVH